jgi:hypothetical protein
MGKQQSWDSPWDMYAMSNYNTITSLSESPVKEGLIYAGTDDGLLQVTEDGGQNWRKIEVSSIPGIPEMAFINDVKADLFDENTVYLVLDNHKYGDLNPYLVKSNDKGRTWESIRSNLPERTLLWRIVQDHVKPELLFVGAEFGVYFTLDGGKKWIKITGDAPTISFRDLAIQRRENDLVGATFGRGFYILDDYSPLREVTPDALEKEAALFPTRDAWWYIPREVLGRGKKGSQGEDMYVAENPPFGAVFTYFLKEDIKTLKEVRQEQEKELQKQDADIPFPGWEELDKEKFQDKPTLWLTVKDNNGEVVRKIDAPVKKGFHRIAWDLRYPAITPLTSNETGRREPTGVLVVPGTYKVSLSKEVDGVVTELDGPVSFELKQLREGSLEGSSHEETVAFWKELMEMRQALGAFGITLSEAMKTVELMETSLKRAPFEPGEMDKKLHDMKMELVKIRTSVSGNSSRDEVGEKNPPAIYQRLSIASTGTTYSTYGPTQTHRRVLEIAREEFAGVKEDLKKIVDTEIPAMLTRLYEAGAPWIEGMPIPEGK